MPVESNDEIEIDVGESPDPSLTRIDALDAIQRKEVEKEFRRQQAADEIARYRWTIAEHVHLLEDGVSRLNFTSHPYQKELFKDNSLDLVLYGSAQFGKTES